MRFLVFASDYPHWDWDEPTGFLADFDADYRHRIMAQNASGTLWLLSAM